MIGFRCSYSHLGNTRVNVSKVYSIASSVGSIVKKIDCMGECIVNCCLEYLNNVYSDKSEIRRLKEEMNKMKKEYTAGLFSLKSNAALSKASIKYSIKRKCLPFCIY
eukprot:TRINITY_DN14845_c0_g1_i2.p1 TRINITY_DN14845_c0_g1~~TRINITY_DN14845_c0_g1_i2.p1  ORF type:complete len:107 (-),score=21.22 TRINITY_DN14845_c0_g1_i2:105-425(-)